MQCFYIATVYYRVTWQGQLGKTAVVKVGASTKQKDYHIHQKLVKIFVFF